MVRYEGMVYMLLYLPATECCVLDLDDDVAIVLNLWYRTCMILRKLVLYNISLEK